MVLALGSCGGDGTAAPPPAPMTRTAAPTPADNGVAAESAEQILKDAVAALQRQRSFRLLGALRDGGDMTRMDLRIGDRDLQGRMTLALKGKSVPVDVAVHGRDFYLRGRAIFEQVGGVEAAKLFGDRWLKNPPNTENAAFVGLFTPEALAKDLERMSAKATKGPRTLLNGRGVIGVADSDTVVYVATTGDPLPLRFSTRGEPLDGEGFNLTEFGVPFTVTPPADAIDITKIRRS
ncbi:hypothetical protein [Thermomonospora umbrina]|nr:hypothetical protein [Thermomonospora umbrina]